MSNTQEERGSLILPSSAVLPMRNTLTKVINDRREYTLEVAGKVHAHLRSEAGKADRKILSALMKGKKVEGCWSVQDLISKVMKKVYPPRMVSGWRGSSHEESSMKFDVDSYEILNLIITTPTPDGEPARLQSPKKKDLPPLLASKTWSWSNEDDELYIRIDPKTRRLTWDISQNNRSVERAHESVLGEALFGALNKVKWTRGTGGVSYYSDEYMKESLLEGDSAAAASYYGPLGDKEQEYKYAPLKRLGRRKSTPKR